MNRARTESAKLEKANHILKNAFKIYRNKNYKEFTMDELAKASGYSKGLLFKYYKSKEELFLCMLKKEYLKRYDFIEKLVSKYNSRLNNDDIRDIFLSILENDLYYNKTFQRLLNIKSAILEQSSDYEFTKQMKSELHKRHVDILSKLSIKSNLSKMAINDIFISHDAIFAGYLQNIVVSNTINEVLEKEELKYFKTDHKRHALSTYKLFLDKGLGI